MAHYAKKSSSTWTHLTQQADTGNTNSMEPVPMKVEMPPKPVEGKAPPAPPKDKPAEEKPLPESGKSARATLEEIAKGAPVAEATAPKTEAAPLPDREKVDALLSQANELLLDLRDMRLAVTALATNAADTPLGNETRIDTLKMLAKMSNEGMPPDAVLRLSDLQKQIADLKLPDKQPGESALLPVIDAYNQAHPDQAVPAEVVNQIKSGDRDAATTVAQLLQTNQDLASGVWKELTGVEGFQGLNFTPQNVLELAGLPATKENLSKADELFGIIKSKKSLADFGGHMGMQELFMSSALVLMAFNQIAGIGQGGGGGH